MSKMSCSKVESSKIGKLKPSIPRTFNLLTFITLFTLLLGVAAPGAALAQQAQRKMKLNQVGNGTWPDVTLNLTLTGPDGKAVPDVLPSQFQVLEQGQPQALTGLELGPARSVPPALVLVMDVSGSMNANNKLNQSKVAANAFLNSMRPEDSVALVAFNDQVNMVVPPTNDKGKLQAGVNALQAGGNTAIYDSLYRAAQILNPVPANKRRAVILLTDGADTSSKYSARVAADTAKQTGALVYTIGLGPDANDSVLSAVADPTGGKYFKAPSADDLNGIYNAISIELDSQLFLKYKSSTHLDRSYQLITVEVKYTAPGGQVVSQKITYRPRASLITSPQSPSSVEPVQAPIVVGLPSGISRQVEVASTPPQVPWLARLLGLGAALLAGMAALCGTIGLAFILTPTLTSQRVTAYVGGDSASSSKAGPH